MGRAGKRQKARERRERRQNTGSERKTGSQTVKHLDRQKAQLVKQKNDLTKRFNNFKRGNAYQLSIDGSCYEGYGSRGLNQQYRTFQQELKKIETALRDLDPEAKLRRAQEKRFGKEINLLKSNPNTISLSTAALFRQMPTDIDHLIRRSLGEGKFISEELTCSHFKRVAHHEEEEEEEWRAACCTCDGKYLNAHTWEQFLKRRVFVDFSLQALQEKDLNNKPAQAGVTLNVHHQGFAGELARDMQTYVGGLYC